MREGHVRDVDGMPVISEDLSTVGIVESVVVASGLYPPRAPLARTHDAVVVRH